MGYRVEWITAGHLDRVAEIVGACRPAAPPAMRSKVAEFLRTPSATRAELRDFLAGKGQRFDRTNGMVALADSGGRDVVAGYLTYGESRSVHGAREGHAFLLDLGVDPIWRHEGAASALLGGFVEWATAAEGNHVWAVAPWPSEERGTLAIACALRAAGRAHRLEVTPGTRFGELDLSPLARGHLDVLGADEGVVFHYPPPRRLAASRPSGPPASRRRRWGSDDERRSA